MTTDAAPLAPDRLTPDAFRARFPLLTRRVYVNSCSQGALSHDVRAAMEAFLESWQAGGSPWEDWIGEVERLRAAFASLIGADADEIAVMPSASAAIAAVATALSFDSPRHTVLVGDFAFPTLGHVWLAQQRRGAAVDWVSDGAPSCLDAYAARIGPGTLLVAATHVSFRNGSRIDVPALVDLTRSNGALFMLDDYQRTGTAPIDVHALGVDFLVTGALKYLLGASGLAFLYVRRELIGRLEPLVTGWLAREQPFAFDPRRFDWASSARRFEGGTPPVPNAYAARAGIALLEQIGVGQVAHRIRGLVARFLDGALARGFDVVTPIEPAGRGPLIVLRSTDAAALVQRLGERGIIASSRGDGLRVSFHAYNDEADVDAVIAALDGEAALLARAIG